ncbi:hypothetical protein LWI28_003963 [Acer negundo]|uniref:Uncharacterized protein n=1 Tax=Acer negundo TaxID=4023 RepID=A0AAD5J2R9_ACENE|nr:hypothetical protein LWI28_003963 [Acer negundo]
MTTDSEEGLSNSDGGSLSRQEIKTLIQKEVRKRSKRAGASEPVTKRVKKGEIREIKGEMRVMKREIREIKRWIQNLTPDAPADRNVNPRTSLDHQITRSEEGKYQLLFVSKLHDSIFTKDKIKDVNGEYVKVEIKLIDTIMRDKTVDAGDLSSIKIEIVVLEGDFSFEGNWTEPEFNAKIVNKKKDKGPLLVKGKQVITLKNGVGTIDDLSFFSISSWTKSGKFRLGARVLQSNSRGQVIRIKEAKSEAFAVKHLRGKMKHLKKIKEGGKFHKALIENNIRTDSDLKQMYKKDHDKLKDEILKGCSKLEWDAIVQHVIRVVDDDISNPLKSQEAEAYNSATTGPPLRDQFQSIHQGSTGMENDSNLAYESTAHPTENFQHFSTLQPPANMSTPSSQVDALLEQYMAMPPYGSYDDQALLEQYTWQSYNI